MLARSAAYLPVRCIRFSISLCLVLGVGPLEAASAAFPMCMCDCVRVFARTMCQNEIDFEARRRSVLCGATDSNFPRAVVHLCVCGWCFVPNENIQLFVVIQQLLHQALSHEKKNWIHSLTLSAALLIQPSFLPSFSFLFWIQNEPN